MIVIYWLGAFCAAALAILIGWWFWDSRDSKGGGEHAAPRSFRVTPTPRPLALPYMQEGSYVAMSRPSLLFERDTLDSLIEAANLPGADNDARPAHVNKTLGGLPRAGEPTPNQRMNLWFPREVMAFRAIGSPADTGLRRGVRVEWADRMLDCPLAELDRVVDADRRHVKALEDAA